MTHPLKEPCFQTYSHAGLEWLEARSLQQFPWLLHAFSTRPSGLTRGADLDLGAPDTKQSAAVRANRRRFLAAIGGASMALAAARQIHSTLVLQVEPGPGAELRYFPPERRLAPAASAEIPTGDALLTQSHGVLLSVRTADCLPILIADPQTRAVAAIHAGWRGALGRIVEKTVGEMRRVFGSEPRHLFVALGPSIRACCYEVGEEVIDAFSGAFVNSDQFFRKMPVTRERRFSGTSFLSMEPPGHARPRGAGRGLDLVAVAMEQLKGVPRSHIQTASFCTSCRNDLFFSWRKEGTQAGRMMAVIGIRRIDGEKTQRTSRKFRVES